MASNKQKVRKLLILQTWGTCKIIKVYKDSRIKKSKILKPPKLQIRFHLIYPTKYVPKILLVAGLNECVCERRLKEFPKVQTQRPKLVISQAPTHTLAHTLGILVTQTQQTGHKATHIHTQRSTMDCI